MTFKGGKIKQMKDILGKEPLTIEEIISITGLKKSTILDQLKYKLNKKGVKIEISEKNGQIAYKII